MEKSKKSGRYAGEKQGHFTGDKYEFCDLPGFDGFDDGLGANGKLLSTGSNVIEGGSSYMEDKGPNDLRHHDGEMHDTIMELDPEIYISSASEHILHEEHAHRIGLEQKDEADFWLENFDSSE